MKATFKFRTLYIIALTFFSFYCLGQERLNRQFIVSNKLFEISVQQEVNKLKVKVAHQDSLVDFNMRGLSLDVFKFRMRESVFSNKLRAFNPPTSTDTLILDAKSEELYFQLYSNIDPVDAPKAGVMAFNDQIEVSHGYVKKMNIKILRNKRRLANIKWFRNAKKTQERISARIDRIYDRIEEFESGINTDEKVFLVDTVQMEILDGTIRNLIVSGRELPKENNETVEEEERGQYFMNSLYKEDTAKPLFRSYRNVAPVSISSLYDVRIMYKAPLRNVHDPFDNFYLNLRDVIKYNPFLSLKSDDYSPRDSVYVVRRSSLASSDEGELPALRLMLKEETKYLFMARVYTDFNGFSENNPNGLLQTEVSKKIFINAQNRLFLHPFNYLEPQIRISKIENNLRQLDLGQTEYTGLNVHRYSYFSMSARLNMLTIDLPQFKFVMRYDLMGSSYWVSLLDTSDQDSSEVVYGLDHNLSMEFRPDSRWTIDFSMIFGRNYNLRSQRDLTFKRVNTAQVDVSFRPNIEKTQEVFLRGSVVFDTQVDSFQRLQLGYAFPIIKTK